MGFKSWLYCPEEVTGLDLLSLPWTSEATIPSTAEDVTEKDVEKGLSSISVRLSTPPTKFSNTVCVEGLEELIIVSFSEDDEDNLRN